MKKRIIALVLALNMIINLSGCASKSKKNDNDKAPLEYEDTIHDQDEEKTEYIDYASNIINGVKTHYGFDDYYPTDDTINSYKALADSTVMCSLDDTNYIQLLNIIEENTIRKYGKNNGIFIIPGQFYSDEELAKLSQINQNTKIAIKNAIKNIFENASNNIQEDISTLKNISIINSDLQELDETNNHTNLVLGLWEKEKLTITIDYNAIVSDLIAVNYDRKEKGRNEIDLVEYLTRTIEHEINHTRQYAYDKRLENNQKYENINLMEGPSFFSESSAEAELYIFKDFKDLLNEESFDYTYYDERSFETLLFLLAVFQNNSIEGYYNAIFDSDLKAFWDYFKLENSEELQRFYSILYSIDTLCGRTDLSEKICDGKNQTSIGNLKENVGTSYLIDLFKFNIIDLISATEKDNLSLEDSLMLYLYSKSYITDSSYAIVFHENEYGKIEKEYNDYYISAIQTIENAFIEYISVKYKLTTLEIKEMIESFDLNIRLSSFIDYTLGNNYYCSENDKNSFDNLLKKYPIIKHMLWTNPCYYYNVISFNDYIKNNEKTLVLN